MPIISVLQGSDEWLDYRQSRIMATDIPVILGSNPWVTKLERWEEKIGLRSPPKLNDAMKRGQELEPEARILASSLIGLDFQPIVWESDKYSWLAASLDGFCNNYGKYILEIKCPKEETHNNALDDIIPEYYIDQIQTQLLVTGAEICYFFSYRPEKKERSYAIIPVRSDLEKQAEIISKGQEFYINMCTMNPPEEWRLELRK